MSREAKRDITVILVIGLLLFAGFYALRADDNVESKNPVTLTMVTQEHIWSEVGTVNNAAGETLISFENQNAVPMDVFIVQKNGMRRIKNINFHSVDRVTLVKMAEWVSPGIKDIKGGDGYITWTTVDGKWRCTLTERHLTMRNRKL